MDTRVRQAAAAAVVAGRNHVPAVRRRRRLLRIGGSRGYYHLRAGVEDGAAAGRRHRRVDLRADHRWPALLPVHRGEVQPRRHTVAVLGARGLVVSRGAAAWPYRTLALARP